VGRSVKTHDIDKVERCIVAGILGLKAGGGSEAPGTFQVGLILRHVIGSEMQISETKCHFIPNSVRSASK
jgi:hypothetical protein